MSGTGASQANAWQGISKETVYFVIILAVIILYCAPLILIASVYICNYSLGTPIDIEKPTVKWFIAFAKGHEHSLGQVHKILIPLITFIAAAGFATASSTWRTLVLSLMILFFFFLAIFMQVAFEASAPDEVPMVSPFFSRIEETLITYLMLILGLQVAKNVSDRNETTDLSDQAPATEPSPPNEKGKAPIKEAANAA